jgi:hypothetical protein
MLQEHRQHQLQYKLKLGEKFQNEHNLVFTSKTGTIVSIRNLQRRHFKPLLVKAKVPDLRLYDLRHTCATLLLAAGGNPRAVSEGLGHASIVLTLDTYWHCLPTMQKSATKRLERIGLPFDSHDPHSGFFLGQLPRLKSDDCRLTCCLQHLTSDKGVWHQRPASGEDQEVCRPQYRSATKPTYPLILRQDVEPL